MTDREIPYQKLIDFAAGDLDAQEAAGIERALETDEDARRTVGMFREIRAALAADDSVAPPQSVVDGAKSIFRSAGVGGVRSWLEGLDRFIATLRYDSRAEPALAGFRGAADTIRLTFESEPGEVDLEISSDPAAADDQRRVTGQISAPRFEPPVRVALARRGSQTVVAETESDDGGMFSLAVSPGTYDLCIGVGDGLIVVPDLEIE